MYILRSMFVISGSSLYPGFIIVRFDCIYMFVYNILYICGVHIVCFQLFRGCTALSLDTRSLRIRLVTSRSFTTGRTTPMQPGSCTTC